MKKEEPNDCIGINVVSDPNLNEVQLNQSKKETLEEVANEYAKNRYSPEQGFPEEDYYISFLSFRAGAKWQQERMYSKEEVTILLQNIINEIEIRKQNIISKSEKMSVHLLEGGCIAFESSQDVVKEQVEQFKNNLKTNKI